MTYYKLYIMGRIARMRINGNGYEDDEILCAIASYVDAMTQEQIEDIMEQFDEEDYRKWRKDPALFDPLIEFHFCQILSDRGAYDCTTAPTETCKAFWNKVIKAIKEA